MKATGLVRRIDDLGRVVIPKEIRRTHGIHTGDPLEIFVDSNGGIIFRKYQPETWSMDELKDALVAAAKETGKDPVDYLNAARKEAKS